MDFVERLLSVSPDGGSGSFEVSTILAVLIVICVLVFRGKLQTAWYRRTKMSGRSDRPSPNAALRLHEPTASATAD